MGAPWYVALSYGEIFTIDNQSWLSVHYYVVRNQVKILIFIYLNIVLESLGSDNLTKVIMEALTIGGRLPRNWIAQKLTCFGADDVNVFQGTKNGVTKQIHDTFAPHSIGVHFMAQCINLVG